MNTPAKNERRNHDHSLASRAETTSLAQRTSLFSSINHVSYQLFAVMLVVTDAVTIANGLGLILVNRESDLCEISFRENDHDVEIHEKNLVL